MAEKLPCNDLLSAADLARDVEGYKVLLNVCRNTSNKEIEAHR